MASTNSPDPALLPTLQGAQSTTFVRPPLDGRTTIQQIYAHHAACSPEHPVFVYATGADERVRLVTVRHAELHRAVRRAAAIVSRNADADQHVSQRGHDLDLPIVGLLSAADTISGASTILGIIHAGFTPFPISLRNSPPGIAHLVRTAHIRQLYVSPDASVQRLALQAKDLLAAESYELEILSVPLFADLYAAPEEVGEIGMYAAEPKAGISMNDVAIVLHTSGSTAFPKLIKIRQATFVNWGKTPYYGEVDYCGKRIGAEALPLFHSMGAAQIAWSGCSGSVWSVFEPANPAKRATPEAYLELLDTTQADIAYCVPAFVEAWARDARNFEKLRRLTAIIFGGAPLNKDVGDKIVDMGIVLTPIFGSTESGVQSVVIPAKSNKESWEYFRLSTHLSTVMIPQEGTKGIYEIVTLSSPLYVPNAINCTHDGVPAYRTNDLLQEHPTMPGFWKVFGRADDQLMLSTGEKTNPIPLEGILMQDPHIALAVMFGRGRFQNGVLIEPSESVEPTESALEEFRNKIWPSVEKANAFAPSHSRIFKEMIALTSPAKPFERTAKGTARRQAALDAYADEIDRLYVEVERSSQAEIHAPDVWTRDKTTEFVREAVRKVVGDVSDADDMFVYGCDSLQATWIRNTVVRALRTTTKAPVHEMPLSFVYTYPSIEKLSAYVYDVVTSRGAIRRDETVKESVEAMRAAVEKYAGGIESLEVEKRQNQNAGIGDGEVVVLTGSTGHLGCHLLVQMIQDDRVQRVYALNRAAGGDVRARQAAALEKWELDRQVLESKRLVLLAADISKPHLGLEKEVFGQIAAEATIIVHNAWRVDFNVRLSAFSGLLASVQYLLALSRSARFVFISSVAVLANQPRSTPVSESDLIDAHTAVGMGYSESKWVAERLLLKAHSKGRDTVIVRVGQLCGDTRNGAWNSKEWLPTLLKIGQETGCLPKRDEVITWVPIDVAATAIQEMAHAPSAGNVLHLVSPRAASWDALFSVFAKELGVPLVPMDDFLVRLHALAAAADAHVPLLEFFRRGDYGNVLLECEQAVRASMALARVQELRDDDARRVVGWQRKLGALKE